MKYLIIGDLHFKEKLGYADYISDGRKAEKKEVLDYIRKLSTTCDKIIFMGDQLNGRNNPSEVIREFVEFVESLGKKEIYMIAGNHEKSGDGKTAIDFMKEVNKKNWHIITDEVVELDGDVFCPYFYKGELGAKDNKEAVKILMDKIVKGKNLFIHHALSGYTFNHISTDSLNEIVLPKATLTKRFDNIFCGHIHAASCDTKNKVVYTGSIFTDEVNEDKKYVYVMEDGAVEDFVLPCRPIVKVENPTVDEIKAYSSDTILKVILSNKISKEELESTKEALTALDGSILIEDFKIERKVIKFKDGDLDLDIDNLIKIYAKDRKVDLEKLQNGYELIK